MMRDFNKDSHAEDDADNSCELSVKPSITITIDGGTTVPTSSARPRRTSARSSLNDIKSSTTTADSRHSRPTTTNIQEVYIY